MTPVVFRAERSGDFKGDVTAVFPTLAADVNGNQMTCYSHIGQHSGCSLGWYSKTRLAKPEEYAALLKELVAIGYDDLRIVKRVSRTMTEERIRPAMTEKVEMTELNYYAAARDDGWSFGDEDTPKEYCESNLTEAEVAAADIEFWRAEFEWWKAKP